jgi:geranylgeranyl diphosphate synthase type II
MSTSALDKSRLRTRAAALLQRDARLVEPYLHALAVSRYPAAPQKLLEAMDYSLMAGGKRLRPTLVLECWRACSNGSIADDQPPSASALAAAGAIELIHTFSLVHDDLPAMDDDDLRRGRPTNHKIFGEAMAILAGDAMVTVAFELIAADADPAHAPGLIGELAGAAGPIGMIGGQVRDMESEGRALSLDELASLHAMKTGALLTCACRMGAIAAGADASQLAAMGVFGRHLGLAFQIVDDLLDLTATPEQLGKKTRKDADRGKNTYPALLGIDGSRQKADEQLDAALSALEPFGAAAENLRILARFVVERDH